MKADFALVRQLIHGAEVVSETDGCIEMNRFTDAERKVYSSNEAYTKRTFAASGIRLEFRTDARSLVLAGSAEMAASREFYYFDVTVNGVLLHHAGFESCRENPQFRFEFGLDGAANRVCIYFPCLTRITLSELEFNGGSSFQPVTKQRKMICYGDSITQGYDARFPSLSYPNQLADFFQTEMFNKAIGGDKFNPPLAKAGTGSPDLITVAYGTNDWSHCPKAELERSSGDFFRNLTAAYPGVPVYAILPIWRTGCETVRKESGSFADLYELLRETVRPYPQIRPVNGLALVPHVPECFSPDILHPNDFGFQFMGRNLIRELSQFSD